MISIDNYYVQQALLNFSNNFYNYLDVSKIVYLENITVKQYVSSTNDFSFINLFVKFLAEIEWDVNDIVSSDKLNSIYSSKLSLENIVSEDVMLLNGNVADTLLNSKYSVSLDSSKLLNYGTITNLLFKYYYNSVYKNPELVDDSQSYYYSFSKLYNFYSVDIFRTSFLFFENVRHSTKLEIV